GGGAVAPHPRGRAAPPPRLRLGHPMRRRIEENPFYVLELRPGASRAEIEQQGQKLLAMLALGLAEAARYPTPFGTAPRSAERVRAALAELRDPERRGTHELWAGLEPGAVRARAPAAAGWPEAFVALGWRS